MKESKISLLLLVSLALLLLAFVVLFVWGFTYYKKTTTAPETFVTSFARDSATIAQKIKDSLQLVYNATLHDLNRDIDSTKNTVDSYQVNLDAKLQEFTILKTEISTILQNRNSSSSDLNLARRKIAELQQRVSEWKGKYSDIDKENKRLATLLQQLSQNTTVAEEGAVKKMGTDIKPSSPDKNIPTSPFVVSDIQLRAIMQLDDREQETFQAVQTDQFNCSIEMKNSISSVPGTEMYVVVLQPDGKVLKQSAWESGIFETSEGRKIYSCKLRFDYIRGENKHISFSLRTGEFQKGIYSFQLYHNGKIIARATKGLS